MNLPQEPGKIPPVRRYQRSFYADRTKTYRGEEVVKIQIPPISKTYLTKDVKLHFDLDISYYENTTENMQTIANTLVGTVVDTELDLRKSITYGFFGLTPNNTPNPNTVYFQTMSKPFPTLDINGPYGLISRIQVHDYLGTTLIEDIQSHDVLTAVMADFMFTNDNVEIFRPEMSSEEPTFGSAIFKPPASLPFNSVNEFEDFMMTPYNTTITWATNPVVQPMKPTSIPTYHATIDLFSFMGKLSQKFIPLHNGFTISFTLNRFDIPIGFSNGGNPLGVNPPNDELAGFVRGYTGVSGGKPITSESVDVYFKPTLDNASIKNMYIKSTLIEVDQQLDDQIEKVVQCIGYKYQLDYFPTADTSEKQVDFTRRLLPQLKSLRRVLVGQRPRFNPSDVRKQRLGFRVKNFIDKSALLYNKSIISSIESNMEAYNALRSCYGPIDKYLTMSDFELEYESSVQYGDQSWLMNTVKLREFLNAMQQTLFSSNNYNTFWFDASFYNKEASEIYGHQGKHLLCFDCVVPGSTANTVAGIDTSSNVVEYQLKSTRGVESVNIDVFLEHDAFVHVDPGKATAVSF